MGNAVVHFEIHGTDRAALQNFYSTVFGWEIRSMDEMDYGVIDTNGGGGINGGIAHTPENATRQIIYIEADDVGAMLAQAEQLGATKVMDVTSIPNGPTIALFADTAGNVIGLVGGPDEEPMRPSKGEGNPVAWFEINGGNFETQTSFYAALCGWEYQIMNQPEFDYAMLGPQAEYGSPGAISVSKDGTTGVTVWAGVDDLQATLDKIEANGGKTDMPPAETPDGPAVATYFDPQGNRLGIYKE